MATQPDTPPAVSNWPDSPSRARPLDFPEEADSFLGHFPTGQTDQQNVVDWTNQTAQQVYDNALESAASASNSESSAQDAALSAQQAQNSSNLLGDWSSLTGSVSIGQTVIHNAGRWQAKTDIADVTLSEPSLSNVEWFLIEYQSKVITVLDSETLTVNATNELKSTQSNAIPLASSVPSGWILTVTVAPEFRGITSTHLVSGSDTTTDNRGNISDGFICEWPNGGALNLVSNGLDNWRVLNA